MSLREVKQLANITICSPLHSHTAPEIHGPLSSPELPLMNATIWVLKEETNLIPIRQLSERCPLVLWSYEGEKYPPCLWLSRSRSSEQGKPGPSFSLAFQTGISRSKQGLWQAAQSVFLICYLGQRRGRPHHWGCSHGWEGQEKRSRVLLKGTVMGETGLPCVWECVPSLAARPQRRQPASLGESAQDLCKKPFLRQQPVRPCEKELFFPSGVNLSKLPPSLGLSSCSYKVE